MTRYGWIFGLTCLMVACLTLLARPIQAQAPAQGGVTATQIEGRPAAWVLLGNKLYFIEKDSSTVLKVTASGVI